MCVQWEIQPIVLVLMSLCSIDAHILGALEACQEFPHGNVESGGVSRFSQGLQADTEGLGVGQVDGLKAYFVEKHFQFIFLFLV